MYPHQVRHIHDWAEGLSFYYSGLLHCLNQILTVVLLSQHRVSSSKTVRFRAPCGAQLIGHAVEHGLRFVQGHHTLNFMKKRDPICAWTKELPNTVRNRLSLTQAARGKPIPTGLAPVLGTKTRSLEALSQYSVFQL